jgi:hypothetical protein
MAQAQRLRGKNGVLVSTFAVAAQVLDEALQAVGGQSHGCLAAVTLLAPAGVKLPQWQGEGFVALRTFKADRLFHGRLPDVGLSAGRDAHLGRELVGWQWLIFFG